MFLSFGNEKRLSVIISSAMISVCKFLPRKINRLGISFESVALAMTGIAGATGFWGVG